MYEKVNRNRERDSQYMKRWIGLLLTVCIAISFAGCFRVDPNIRPVTSDESEYINVNDLISDDSNESSTTSEASESSMYENESSSENTVNSSSAITTKASSNTSGTTKAGTTTKTSGTTTQPSQTGGEFRAVWVSYIELSTLFNGKSEAEVKSAIDLIMDNSVSYHMTAVIFHVRANGDAYYKSSLFKAAKSVATVIAGGFDPLAYAVESAHKRGLELHAWVNPYRIGTDLSYKSSSCNDYYSYGDRYYYTPTSETAQKLILDGIRELVNNYAIDGIQYDDYFYMNGSVPDNTPASFETDAYAAYKSAGGTMVVADWRRTNVNALVRGTYSLVHGRNGCVFGVSPFFKYDTTFSRMYADTKMWMANAGYVDYMCPQIYFGFENQTAAFNKQVDIWLGYPRHSSVKLYVGLAMHKTGMTTDVNAGTGNQEWIQHGDIMKRSVEYLRTKSKCDGMMFFSYSFFRPDTLRTPSYDASVAQQEITNLLAILAK